MAIYAIETDFDTTYMRADFAQASSPIEWADALSGPWHHTQYQVADARHYPSEAAVLVYDHLGAEHWLPDGVELDDLQDEREYIRQNIIGSVGLVTCECTSCACDNPATTVDGSVNVCDECARYYSFDGEIICSRVQDSDSPCRHCDEKIEWGRIQTGPAIPNYIEGKCGCEGRNWRQEDHGGNWVLSEDVESEERELGIESH